MNIALIGYGKMGKIIEHIATERGHTIVAIIDEHNRVDFASESFASADVAIEFTTPASAEANIRQAWEASVPVVCGTTGWTAALPQLKTELQTNGKTLFWASNFSLGVNVFFAVNRYLAHIMNRFDGYSVDITEIHHMAKKDAPSGTAITMAEQIADNIDRKEGWQLDSTDSDSLIPIHAIREGEVPGTHTVVYESHEDSISLTHAAKSRDGFALGAVLAAEFTVGKSGFLSMNDLLKF